MPVTMRDVARRAGVSVKTVSNVVNEFPHVSPATRDRVLAAISDLGYQMNFSARNLSLGRTGMITLAVPEMRLPYFAELADEVIVAAAERGYTVLVERTGGVRDRELEALTSDRRRMTDGLIFSPLGLRPADAHRLEVDYPLVLLGERALHGSVHHVAMGNVAGARAATEHLLQRGRRRIAVIGSYDERGAGAGSLRTQGFTGALADAGIEHDPRRTGEALEWTRTTGAEAMRRVLDSGVEVDAVYGLNDVLALGAMRVLFERGLRVPEDVAVAGFDDIEDGRFSAPSLTTVQPGRDEIARTAVWLLVDRITRGLSAGSNGRELVVAPELMVRESTGGETLPA
ncbi:LacI family DNA-binding transcriptional regulator [Streptomonospora litoralis]|uniref:HTH-type transcriptional repressor CytR n=1 Tax=Streptomonospora litoralis TaxID=2498135 RepID=A0A4P6PVC1_9ACTN|nr:LacI family DNA-binding transcriptional regulator [Streptomonospora litoralis]QBI52156.1 HTH-type transcriptional repressor CytR [Streptomonospora litoralis]